MWLGNMSTGWTVEYFDCSTDAILLTSCQWKWKLLGLWTQLNEGENMGREQTNSGWPWSDWINERARAYYNWSKPGPGQHLQPALGLSLCFYNRPRLDGPYQWSLRGNGPSNEQVPMMKGSHHLHLPWRRIPEERRETPGCWGGIMEQRKPNCWSHSFEVQD